jgi:hypothetical protein
VVVVDDVSICVMSSTVTIGRAEVLEVVWGITSRTSPRHLQASNEAIRHGGTRQHNNPPANRGSQGEMT